MPFYSDNQTFKSSHSQLPSSLVPNHSSIHLSQLVLSPTALKSRHHVPGQSLIAPSSTQYSPTHTIRQQEAELNESSFYSEIPQSANPVDPQTQPDASSTTPRNTIDDTSLVSTPLDLQYNGAAFWDDFSPDSYPEINTIPQLSSHNEPSDTASTSPHVSDSNPTSKGVKRDYTNFSATSSTENGSFDDAGNSPSLLLSSEEITRIITHAFKEALANLKLDNIATLVQSSGTKVWGE